MIDINSSYEFIQFLKDPIKNYLLLNKHHKQKNKKSLLISLPFIKTIFPTSPAYDSFEKDVVKLIKLNQNTINNTETSYTNVISFSKPKKEIRDKDILDCLKEYFYIGVYFDTKKEMESCGEDYIKKVINKEHNTKLNYQLVRIFENAEFSSEQSKLIITETELFLIYLCSELLFFLDVGWLNIQLKNDEYKIFPSKEGKENLSLYWLSAIIDEEFLKVTYESITAVSNAIIKSKPISQSKLHKVCDATAYYLFSIKTDFVSYGSQKQQNDFFYSSLKFVMIIECFSLSGKNKVSIDFISQIKLISDKHLHWILEYLKTKSNSLSFSENIHIENSMIIRGIKSFKVSSTQFISSILQYQNHKNGYSDNLLYDLNENNISSVKNYFNNVNRQEFHIFDGFELCLSNEKKMIIDLVLYNKKEKNYYFVNLNMDIEITPSSIAEMGSTEKQRQIKNAVKDLTEFKHALGHSSIQKELSKHQIINATFTNSYFIIFHNKAHFNFIESQGIILYEWRIFNYIFQSLNRNESGSIYQNNKKLPSLYAVDKIIKQYLENANNNSVKKRLEIHKNAFSFFKLGNKSVIAKTI